MKTERMPWTCRWSEYRASERPAVWLDEWLSQWSCLAEDRQPPVTELGRCQSCRCWEPRHGWTEADRVVR